MADAQRGPVTTSTLSGVLDDMMAEARTLRSGLEAMPGTAAAPHEMHDYLLDVRRRLDRIEQLVAIITRIRGNARRFCATAAAHAEEAWDEAITRIRSAPVRRGDEFSSARERAAEANLATITERRAAQDAADAAAWCDETYDHLRLLYRGLDGVRHDTLQLLRLLQFESHLER
jgi:hypothetical protein